MPRYVEALRAVYGSKPPAAFCTSTLKLALRIGCSVKSTVTTFAPFVKLAVNEAGGDCAQAALALASQPKSVRNAERSRR